MSIESKIKAVAELGNIRDSLAKQGKRVVLCHGCFDLLHVGHIRHFHQAKKHGDVLMVTITADQYVDKGPNRPAFNQELRSESLASLQEIDYVAINEWPTALETLKIIRPAVYAKGSEFKRDDLDYTGKIGPERELIQSLGGEMVFTEDIVFSSTNLINSFLSVSSDELQEYLEIFKSRYSIKDVHQFLDEMSEIDVVVVGDTIIDEYTYCSPLGMANKEPCIVVEEGETEIFAGGVLAVTNHLANFARQVTLVTVLGRQDPREDFIKNSLMPNITLQPVWAEDIPTLVKQRYIGNIRLNKMLEIYNHRGKYLPHEIQESLVGLLAEQLPSCHMAVAADFGHGALGNQVVELLTHEAPFLALNTQTNAGNMGCNTISRYPRADFVCITEKELRLDRRNMEYPMRPLLKDAGRLLSCRQMVATKGSKGCVIWSQDGDFFDCPAFSIPSVDSVGTGDAFFSGASLATKLGAEPEMVGFIGNTFGAIANTIMGNARPVNMMEVKKFVTSVLK